MCCHRYMKLMLDEFRGGIDVSHILRWLDRYPVSVETKGGSRPLLASKIWITSNLDPRSWYPDLDEDTKEALLRRMNITHFLYLLCQSMEDQNTKPIVIKSPGITRNQSPDRLSKHSIGLHEKLSMVGVVCWVILCLMLLGLSIWAILPATLFQKHQNI